MHVLQHLEVKVMEQERLENACPSTGGNQASLESWKANEESLSRKRGY